MTCTLYGYVTTVEVILDQLRVMFSSPMPPRPAPMKLTAWLRLANQHSGARDATKGKRYSGRNCHTNVTRSRIQNILEPSQRVNANVPRRVAYLHLIPGPFLLGSVSSIHTPVECHLLQGQREHELGVIYQE